MSRKKRSLLWRVGRWMALLGAGGLGAMVFYAFSTSEVDLDSLEDGFATAANESWSSLKSKGPYFGGFKPVAYAESVPFGYVIKNRAYSSRWTPAWRQPAWVAYKLIPVPIEHSGERLNSFLSDWRAFPWTDHQDYTRSGYDRGHMAPHYAVSTRFPLSTASSFLLSNICPQDPDLNRYLWKDLELYIARDLSNNFSEVFVLCGPVFDSDFQTPSPVGSIPVPDSFFLIVTTADPTLSHFRRSAWIIPHDSYRENLEANSKYLHPISDIETVTGFHFFRE